MKDSYKLLDHDVTETKSALADKANRKEIDALNKKIDDLENRSKRYNVVIWSLKEGAEKDCGSVEEFLKEELFNKQMDLENMEVMRAHHTKQKVDYIFKGNSIHSRTTGRFCFIFTREYKC